MVNKVSPEIEQKVLALNGSKTQAEVSKLLNIALPTIRAICERNNVRWKWQVRDQYGEKNSSYINGMGRSTVERLTRRVVINTGRCLHICERCGDYNRFQEQNRHHKDEDRTNNDASNIEVLCVTCHTSEHNLKRKRDFYGRYI
jgi:hypothetical protein